MFHYPFGTAAGSAKTDEPVRLALTDSFRKMAGRVHFGSIDIQHATIDDVLLGLELARATIPVAAPDVAAALHAHNPDCFRIVREDDFARSAMMAYLPLNHAGAAALVDGRFDSASPALEHVCRQGEPPQSLYLWLVYTPKRMTAGLRLLEELEAYGRGVPVFTQPAHDLSRRILVQSGLIEATSLFPAARDGLLVALPAAPADRRAPAISVRVARTVDDVMKAFSIRTATYMNEQYCSYAEEFDGNDMCATHLIGEIDGEPAGCLRIRFFGDFAKLERLAVRPEHRRSRLMVAMVRAAFEHCRKKGFRRLYAHAREDLVPAWQRFGARLVADRPPFRFSDVRFREMTLELDEDPHAIRFGADPMTLIRPEGEWDRLGPLDIAQFATSSSRSAMIEANVRQLKV